MNRAEITGPTLEGNEVAAFGGLPALGQEGAVLEYLVELHDGRGQAEGVMGHEGKKSADRRGRGFSLFRFADYTSSHLFL